MAGSSPSSKTSRSLRRRSVQGYMLQLILDAGSHLHQLVAMQQQLPQVALLRTRHPDGREPARRQQLQQMIGVALVVLLFADRGRANAGRVADDQLMSPALQQALEPAGIAAGLDAHAHPLPLQAAVELLRCARGMMEFLLHSLFRLHIQHGNLLEARMKITAYNLHCGSFRPSPWSFANSRLLGAAWSRRCYQIKRSEGSAVCQLRARSAFGHHSLATRRCGLTTRQRAKIAATCGISSSVSRIALPSFFSAAFRGAGCVPVSSTTCCHSLATGMRSSVSASSQN